MLFGGAHFFFPRHVTHIISGIFGRLKFTLNIDSASISNGSLPFYSIDSIAVAVVLLTMPIFVGFALYWRDPLSIHGPFFALSYLPISLCFSSLPPFFHLHLFHSTLHSISLTPSLSLSFSFPWSRTSVYVLSAVINVMMIVIKLPVRILTIKALNLLANCY